MPFGIPFTKKILNVIVGLPNTSSVKDHLHQKIEKNSSTLKMQLGTSFLFTYHETPRQLEMHGIFRGDGNY